MAYDSGWVADCHYLGRNVFRHDGTGTNDAVVTDRHPGNTIAPTPSHTLFPMTMGFAASFLRDEDPVWWGE